MTKLTKTLAIFGLFAVVLTGCSKNEKKPESSSSEESLVPTYTITWQNYDGSVLEIDENVEEGRTPSYDGATPTREDDDRYTYTFSGWDPAIAPVDGNKTYTATYNRETIKYTIDFDLNGGSSISYKGPVSVEDFTKDIFFFDCVKEGWNFRGWSYKGEKIFDEKGNQLANPEMAKEMTFVALFSQTAKLNIFSNIEKAGTYTGEGEYPYNVDVDVHAEANEGFTFAGWYEKDNLLSTSKDYNFRMWSADVTLEARFINEYHQLSIYSNNEENGTVLLKSETNIDYRARYDEYRAYTSEVEIVAFSKNSVRFLGWFNKNNELVDTNAVYKFIMPNEDYELEAKWDYFTIEYELNGGTNNPNNPDSYTVESQAFNLGDPEKYGSTFLGWRCGTEYITTVNPTMMKNLVLTAVWSTLQYTLTINKFDNAATGTTSLLEGEGYFGEVMTVKATAGSDSVFIGWFNGNTKLTNDAVYSFVMPNNDYTVTAHFMLKRALGMVPYKTSSTSQYFYFGFYPSQYVNTASIINALNNIEEPEANGYYYYRGNYYAKEVLDSATYYSGNIYVEAGTTCWFNVAPMTWRILETSTNYYTAIAYNALEYKNFHNSGASRVIDTETVYPNNYQYSYVREYLNGTFMNKAFPTQSYLKNKSVNNSASTTTSSTNPYACNNTSDKVFLPSYADLHNSNYGFSSNSNRQCYASDYLRCLAAGESTLASTGYYSYLTRSPHSSGQNYISAINNAGEDFVAHRMNYYGIRPMIYVQVASFVIA